MKAFDEMGGGETVVHSLSNEMPKKIIDIVESAAAVSSESAKICEDLQKSYDLQISLLEKMARDMIILDMLEVMLTI